MSKIRVGITGQNGFLGTHLKNQLIFKYNTFEIIPFESFYFDSPDLLNQFVLKCDIIVHLAGINRHKSPEKIYKINVELSQKLSDVLTRSSFKGQLIFATSLHENQDTPYGISKKESNKILAGSAEKADFSYLGLIIPNIFGPFGKPNYNSFIATFCESIIKNETPKIIDNIVNLVYVDKVVEDIINFFGKDGISINTIKHQASVSVMEIWKLLKHYKNTYYEKGDIPNLPNDFEISLFNTFRSVIDIESYFPRIYKKHVDNRGHFVELIREASGGQTSYSTAKPGVTRGNHFHTRKIERFSVIKGKSEISLRRVGCNKIKKFYLDGDSPAYLDIPIWYTHSITNIGCDDLISVFWINEPYNLEDTDTYTENV